MSPQLVQNLRHFDLNDLMNRALRPRYIRTTVVTIQTVSSFLTLSILGLTFYITATSYLGTQSAISALETQLDSIIAKSSEMPQTQGKADAVASINTQVFGAMVVAQPTTAPTPISIPLSLSLAGTFVGKGQQPYAIIEDKKKSDQDIFVIDQDVFGQAVLKAIYEDRVEVLRNGSIEVLKLDDFGGGAQGESGGGSPNEFVIEEAEVDKALENLPLLLTQARAVPYFKEGRSIGLRLFAIKTGSLYERLGLKNGDILKSINGNNLGDLSQALKLFEQLKQERSLSVTLERDKSDQELKYQIR